MRKRTRYSLLVMLALLAVIAVTFYVRQRSPPEVARLLPESDAIVYADVKPLRLATHFDKTAVTRSSDFQAFIDETGIVPERDLDEVAFALHRMSDSQGPNGPVGYSEVFAGRFDPGQLSRYLRRVSTHTETYAGHEIYTIPISDTGSGALRQLRVAQLGDRTIGASNMPSAEQIHSMLDRHRAAASLFSGSSLLSARYGEVPVLSSAWGIGQVGLPFSERGRIALLGLELPWRDDTSFVASLQYRGSIRLLVEQFAPTEEDAARSVQALATLLTLFRSMERLQQGTPANASGAQGTTQAAAVTQAIDSLRIEQHKDRAVLTANIPLDLVKQLATPVPASGTR